MELNLSTSSKGRKEEFERDYDTTSGKIYQKINQRPFLSAVGVVAAGWVLFQVLPFGFFLFLPDWMFKYVKLAFYAAIPSWIFARQVANRLYTVPLDIIKVVDPSDREVVKDFKWEKGKFKDKYDFVGGEPMSWINPMGVRVYKVMEIDKENREARSAWFMDKSPGEIMKFRENYEAQKIWNDEQRRWAAEMKLQLGQLKSRIRAKISNAWIGELEKVEFTDELQIADNDILPEELQDDLEEADILEDLEGPDKLAEELRSKEKEGWNYDE